MRVLSVAGAGKSDKWDGTVDLTPAAERSAVIAGVPEAQVPGFYLVLPRSHRRVKTVAAFCNWIGQERWFG
mgnify:CR=1 FL=1